MRLFVVEKQEVPGCLGCSKTILEFLPIQNIELQQLQFGNTLYANISKKVNFRPASILINNKELVSSDEIKYDGTTAVITTKEMGRYEQPYFVTNRFTEIIVFKN